MGGTWYQRIANTFSSGNCGKTALPENQIPYQSAWVCADDFMAVSALRFSRENNVAIPKSISVVGFEDIPEAFSYGLTTYNFDSHGVMQTMVALISNPSLFPEKQGVFLEKNGFLVPRQSTGPVRKEIGV